MKERMLLERVTEMNDPEEMNHTVGDRGMTKLDVEIFIDGMLRVLDKARDAYYDSMDFAESGLARFNEREATMFSNMMKTVNY